MDLRKTIAGIATPPGRGGVGILRISGPHAALIGQSLIGALPTPRYAAYREFRAVDHSVLDRGIALYFPAPHSFTGEDILELHGHGGPVVLDLLLQQVLSLGARIARPGEFSERAFLNGKLDLAQAEAIADLIESQTAAAARLATRTLTGEFSRRVAVLKDTVTNLRIHLEASLDFAEELKGLNNPLAVQWETLLTQLTMLRRQARQGQLLRDGLTLVIAGRPNAGKSSLLNALAGRDAAIVTPFPGTTRDVLREQIQIDGLPLHIVDTAGLRDVPDPIEREGVRRARQEIAQADRVLWIFDAQDEGPNELAARRDLPSALPVTFIRNKIDLTGVAPGIIQCNERVEIAVSVISGIGLEDLIRHLKDCVGYQDNTEGEFLARRRHLDALERTKNYAHTAWEAWQMARGNELVAEDLRLAQRALGEITGDYVTEDLLGDIFQRFCIGK